jgi:hypothetical protein
VLFREFPMNRLDALAPIVRQAYDITDFDARSKIRKGWGFLERNVAEDEARDLSAALGDAVAVIDNAGLKSLGEPITMTGFTAEPEGVVPLWQSLQEPRRLISWSDVAIIAAGGFAEEVIRRDTGGKERSTGKMLMGLGVLLVTGMPVGLFGGKDKKQVKPVRSTQFITFGCMVTMAGEHFAFNLDHFDFAGLGANKQLNTAANFRTLLAEWKRLSPARLNMGAQFVLANKSLTLSNYQGLHDFETELFWMLNAPATVG